MSLDVNKLEKVRELSGGILKARCPACAETGNDRSGEHLRVYPDGRFGCCVHPKDGAHRKRIFAIAGDRKPRPITVKVANKSARVAVTSINACLELYSGTLGTGISMSRAYEKEDSSHHIYKDTDTAVPSVPSLKAQSETASFDQLPYLEADGTLVIPATSPERYHWWKKGQRLSVDETIAEIKERMQIDASPF
jgi:hypothetical protein